MDGRWRLLKGTNTKTQRFGSMMSFSKLHRLVVCWFCWSSSKQLFGRIGPPSDSSNSAETFQKSHEIPGLCSQVAFPQSMQSLGVMHYGILPEGASQNARASRILGPHMRDGHGVGWKFDDQNLGLAMLAPMSPILWTMGGMGGMGINPQKKQLGGFLLWSLGFTWLYQDYDSSLSPSPSPTSLPGIMIHMMTTFFCGKQNIDDRWREFDNSTFRAGVHKIIRLRGPHILQCLEIWWICSSGLI